MLQLKVGDQPAGNIALFPALRGSKENEPGSPVNGASIKVSNLVNCIISPPWSGDNKGEKNSVSFLFRHSHTCTDTDKTNRQTDR